MQTTKMVLDVDSEMAQHFSVPSRTSLKRVERTERIHLTLTKEGSKLSSADVQIREVVATDHP